MEIPVYLFLGFMDSGKTSLVLETLFLNHFAEEMRRFLLLVCEDGEEEYDRAQIEAAGGVLVFAEAEEDFTGDFLQSLQDEYEPDAVFLEYNGTWSVDRLYEMDGPENWTIVQSLATVDSNTFESYMLNMRSMMVEQLKRAEVVIFNRCTDDTPRAKFRANIKAFNRPAQIVYERVDGTIDEREDELPFDLTKDELTITDADYALWFMDCMDHPEKYDGKVVEFLGLVYNPTEKEGRLKPGTIVPGRFAMTCCVEDIQFLGMKCKTKEAKNIAHKSWISIKARVKKEFAKEYHGDGPVLYPVSIEPATEPEDGLVYFN